MALLPLGSLSLDTAVAVVGAEEGTLASVAPHVEAHMANTKAVECSRKVVYDIAVASMAALEAAAADTGVEVDFEVGMAQVGADYGIVALPGCRDSIRQKPSCLLW